jgi:two-component system, sensor histidine kinase
MNRPDLSVTQRLLTGSAVIAVLIALMGVIVAISLSRIAALRHQQSEVVAPRARAAVELESAILEQAIAFRNYAISGAPSELEAFRRAADEVTQLVERLAAYPKSPEGEVIFRQIVPLVREHQGSFEEYLAIARAGGDRETLRGQEAHISAHRTEVLERVGSFSDIQALRRETADRKITAAIANVRATVIAVTVLILLASFLTSWLVMRSVRGPAIRIIGAADAMRRGEYAPAIALEETGRSSDPTHPPFRDELREAAHIFGRMAATLEAREKRLSAHSRLGAALGSTLDLRQLATLALDEITAYSGGEAGVVYLLDDDGRTLRAVATRALDGEAGELSLGSGIPGQAAADRRPVVVRDIPPDAPFRLRFGLDELPPSCIAAVPITLGERVAGVVVVASLREIGADAIEFIEQSASQLAITLENALAHARIEDLAVELQYANESLQSQNEELQVQSEELQAQSEELQAQSEELQSQNEELQVQSEELQSQSEELRAQKEFLAVSNERLIAAEEQKNRFLAVLGHELRNPLAAIKGAADLFDEGHVEAEPQVKEVISRQTTHLGRLLDDLLDVGRITSGKIELTRRPVELSAIVRRCVSLAASGAGRLPAVELALDEPVWIDGDETRVEQIVTNLLANALKFTPPEGSVTVGVTRGGTDAVVTVADTGIGVEQELLPRIFDFFVQGKGNGARGLGIGLTLVRSLVELHGGNVEAASAGRDRGTTLTVRFPSIAAPSLLTATPSAPEAVEGRSVVLVEDNPDLRKMMGFMLKKRGHRVEEAEDGPAGYERVAAVRPDVALIDLDLPGFDGCEVARRIRSDRQLDGVRLVAVSGYGRPEDRARALEAGFDEHMIKPVDYLQLMQTIDLKREKA